MWSCESLPAAGTGPSSPTPCTCRSPYSCGQARTEWKMEFNTNMKGFSGVAACCSRELSSVYCQFYFFPRPVFLHKSHATTVVGLHEGIAKPCVNGGGGVTWSGLRQRTPACVSCSARAVRSGEANGAAAADCETSAAGSENKEGILDHAGVHLKELPVDRGGPEPF